MLIKDKEKAPDLTARARAAVEWYVKDKGADRPMPDKERDRKLDEILDRLARDLVELSAWFSESAAWLYLGAHPAPPPWALKFLSEEEKAGLGLIPTGRTQPESPLSDIQIQVDQPGQKKGRGRKRKQTEPIQILSPEQIQFLIDHYDELPKIDERTGLPAGALQ